MGCSNSSMTVNYNSPARSRVYPTGGLCPLAAPSLPPQMGRLHQTALCRSASRSGLFVPLLASGRHHQQSLGGFGRSNGTVTFRYKDYARQSQIRSMTLPLPEFLRRFCLHILPLRFVKIRHYGLLLQPRSHRPNHASPCAPGPGSFSSRGGQRTRSDRKARGGSSAGLSSLRTARPGPDPDHPPP